MTGLLPYDRQYQGIAEPIKFAAPIGPSFASFMYGWSEPQRIKVDPRLSIALIASGLFAPVLNPNTQIIQNYESRWHYAWSEPVRLKPGLHGSLQSVIAYSNITPIFVPERMLYRPWVDPVRIKPGLRPQLQQTLALPPRLLPPANVTATMAARETNTDAALFGIEIGTNVPKPYVLFAGANVTITEIPAIKGGALSIEET